MRVQYLRSTASRNHVYAVERREVTTPPSYRSHVFNLSDLLSGGDLGGPGRTPTVPTGPPDHLETRQELRHTIMKLLLVCKDYPMTVHVHLSRGQFWPFSELRMTPRSLFRLVYFKRADGSESVTSAWHTSSRYIDAVELHCSKRSCVNNITTQSIFKTYPSYGLQARGDIKSPLIPNRKRTPVSSCGMAAFGLSKKSADSILRRTMAASCLANNFGPLSHQQLGVFSRGADAVMESASSGTMPQTSNGFALKQEQVDDFLLSSPILPSVAAGSEDPPFSSRKQAMMSTPFALGMAQFWNPPNPQNIGGFEASRKQPALDSGIILGSDATPASPQATLSDFESALDEGAEEGVGNANGRSQTAAALNKLAPDQVRTLTSAGIRLQGSIDPWTCSSLVLGPTKVLRLRHYCFAFPHGPHGDYALVVPMYSCSSRR